MLKQCHVADFETYVLILYTALSDLTIAPPFIPPIAKIGATLGVLVHVDFVLYGARFVRNARGALGEGDFPSGDYPSGDFYPLLPQLSFF